MKNWILLILICCSTSLYAQVLNDECAGTVNLGTAPICTDMVYSNAGATASDLGANNDPDCFVDAPARDVWFSFIADSEITNYVIEIEASEENSNPIQNIQAGLYRGFCPDNVFAINTCAASDINATTLEFEVSGLTPNDLYYIRVDNFGGESFSGDFTICVTAQDQEFTLNEVGSTECSGILYDSGGPNGDYSNGENNTFTICPGVVNQCIEFNLEYYNIEGTLSGANGDVLNFYNGEDTDAPLIVSLEGANGTFPSGNSGVCYTVYAENCLTVQMITDGSTTFEGFKGRWSCSSQKCDKPESIAIDTNALEQDLINSLSSSLVDITITNIDCPNAAYGTFDAGENSDLGIEKGIILTSGSAAYARGPNESDGNPGFSYIGQGDEDLDALSELYGTSLASNDACVIEVEAFVNSSELSFQFLFGSEEYPEFSQGDFNDIFALLIEGPGIEGLPELGGKKNLALIPNTDIPIQIKSVNSETNSDYFRNNVQGLSTEYDGLIIDYQGRQKSLTATSSVIPCNTYKLKFAIADRVDFLYDSGVFISELTNTVPEVTLISSYGFDYLLENCSDGQDQIAIQLSEPQEMDLKFAPVIKGTATLGSDYQINLPDTIVIQAGQTLVTFPITVRSDNLMEGTEIIEIIFQNDFGCGTVEIATLQIELREAIEVVAEGGVDSIYICAGQDYILSADGATSFTWEPAGDLSDATAQNPTFINPSQPTIFTVSGNISPFDSPECTSSDMVMVFPVEPELELIPDGELTLCLGDSIGVQIVSNVEGGGVIWENPDLGVLSPNTDFTFIKPVAASFTPIPFVATLELDGCSVSDTLFLQVDAFELPEALVQDSLICQGYEVQLATDPGNEGVTYQWTPSDYLNNDTIANPIATATEDITYTLVATSFTGACSDSLEINIRVQESELNIAAPDSVFLCFPDSILLSANGTANGADIVWQPTNILTPASGPEVLVKPEVSGYVIASAEFNGCTAVDSVWIETDSLPSMEFEIIQEKDMYCLGEVITVVSAGYDPLDFPDISFAWDPAPGINSPLDERNLAVIAADTALLRRVTVNGACRDTIEKEIFVLDPIVGIIVSDTSALCPGTPVRLMLESEHKLEDIMWDPGTPDLSCDDCIDPIAAFNETTVVTAMMDADGCPATASAQIRVKDVRLNIVFSQNNICPGTPVQLSLQGSGPITDINWSPSGLLSCDDCPTPIASVDQNTTFEVEATVDGCIISTTGTLTIDESIRSATVLVSPNDTVPAGAEITLSVQNEPTFGPNTTYEWFIDGESQGEGGPTFTTTQADTVFTNYQVRIVDENGCSWEGSTQAIGVFPKFRLPNAFTPGGGTDEINDVFRLIQTPAVALDNWQITRFEIFNRWGQRVFECEDRQCAVVTGWDGRLGNNSLAPADVYIYAIQVEIDNGDTIDFKGDVTLLR
ncbi:choice-of-anchor L domain-containing protein [Portibacter marinus]|uniref:choice-of-anchor L domain-containing protein n=1 Tax=Portibacter marinus TaxID=2898660 RepID=UPI001F3C089F|nr:choice-of-anchor L domain-containing protein [Portibacter marinus]